MFLTRTLLALSLLGAAVAHADTNYHALSGGPVAQDWSNSGLIATMDNWSGVPSLEGHLGGDLTMATGVDPQTVLAFGNGTLNVTPDVLDASNHSGGGFAEVVGGGDIAGNPTIAFQGSGSADAPFLLLRLNTLGCSQLIVDYRLRDIDTLSTAVQPVALQARVGEAGNFANVPGGFVANANGTASQTYSITMPATYLNAPQVQVRWITTNAAGVDALIGIDDIQASCGAGPDVPPQFVSSLPANNASNVPLATSIGVQFSEPVQVSPTWLTLNCTVSGAVAVTTAVNTGASITAQPTNPLAFGEQCTATVIASQVADLDGSPDNLPANVPINFTVVADLAPTVVSTVPLDNAGNVPIGTNVSINFSEPVSVTGSWYQILCASSGARTAAVSGGPVSYTLDINGDLEFLENCVVTLENTLIVDLDGTPDPMLTDDVFDFTTAASALDYYASVDATNATTLRTTLHTLIDDHVAYRYSISTNTCNLSAPSTALCDVWDILEAADQDPANPARVLDVYRNRTYTKITDRSGATGPATYNREHTWPNSLGFNDLSGVDANNNPYSPYVDAHMLYTSASDYNSNRGNKPFDNCGTTTCAGTENPTDVNNGGGGGTGAYPGNSNWQLGNDGNTGTYEVWLDRKGDLARAILYMDVRYEGGMHANSQPEPDLIATNNRSLIMTTANNQVATTAYMGVLNTLIAWHFADPPTNQERLRNEVVFGFQGNRNPFIDRPEWVACLWQNQCALPDNLFANGFE